MKIYVADRETGAFIEEVETIEKGLKIIDRYEENDKKDGIYTPNFYNLVNENHETIY